MPLLDLLFTMLWIYLVFLWIWLVVTVFIDIFRSPDLSGWGKAGWSLFVIVLPLLGVLIYMIVRGSSMQQRKYDDVVAQRVERGRCVVALEYVAQVNALLAGTDCRLAIH